MLPECLQGAVDIPFVHEPVPPVRADEPSDDRFIGEHADVVEDDGADDRAESPGDDAEGHVELAIPGKPSGKWHHEFGRDWRENVLGKHHERNAGVAKRKDGVLDHNPDEIENRSQHELSFAD